MSIETSNTSYFEQLPYSTDPRRFAPIAIGVGFLIVCLVIAGLSAFARDDGGAMEFLINEGARRRPAPAAQAHPQVYAPSQARAYAPVQQARDGFWSIFDRPRQKQAAQAPRARAASASAHHVETSVSIGADALGKRSVCVRLCDGYFFPVGPVGAAADITNHDALCSSLCPGAPTRLYIQPAGSDKIEDAISVRDNKPYTALPVAFRHSDKADNTCSCRRPGQTHARLVSAYKDFTLRRGDSIMTEKGFKIFRGSHSYPYKPRDFVGLANDHELSRAQQGRLRKLERAAKYNRLRDESIQPADMIEAASSPRLDRPVRRQHVQLAKPDQPIAR